MTCHANVQSHTDEKLIPIPTHTLHFKSSTCNPRVTCPSFHPDPPSPLNSQPLGDHSRSVTLQKNPVHCTDSNLLSTAEQADHEVGAMAEACLFNVDVPLTQWEIESEIESEIVQTHPLDAGGMDGATTVQGSTDTLPLAFPAHPEFGSESNVAKTGEDSCIRDISSGSEWNPQILPQDTSSPYVGPPTPPPALPAAPNSRQLDTAILQPKIQIHPDSGPTTEGQHDENAFVSTVETIARRLRAIGELKCRIKEQVSALELEERSLRSQLADQTFAKPLGQFGAVQDLDGTKETTTDTATGQEHIGGHARPKRPANAYILWSCEVSLGVPVPHCCVVVLENIVMLCNVSHNCKRVTHRLDRPTTMPGALFLPNVKHLHRQQPVDT